MKYHISTSIAGLLRTATLPQALKVVRDAGFRCLDFPISVFSRPADSPLKSDHWENWTNELRRRLNGEGFHVTQAHASWEQAIPEDLHFESPYPVYARTIAACRMLGCGKLVFHAPLYFFPMKDRQIQQKVNEWNIRWFQSLVPLLEEYNVTAELENTFDYRRVCRPGDPPFTYTAAQDMLSLMEGIGSAHVRLCLDTGHGNIAGQDPAQMARAYGKNLQVLHLNDNFGFIQPVYEDLHLLPGHGNLNWPDIFQALYEIGYTGNFNLEPVGSLPSLPDALRVIQLRSARESLIALASSAGFPM